MLAVWHEKVMTLPEPLKAEAIKRLNQQGLRTRPFIRHTYEQLLSAATYLREYGHLLKAEQIEAYILDKYNDPEKTCIYALMQAKTDQDRDAVHRKVRSELQRTRRAIIAVVDEVQKEFKPKKKRWFQL